MIKKLLITYLFLITNVFAGLPPTTMRGQSQTLKPTTFNFQVPNKQATITAASTSLIETGNNNELENRGFEHTTVTTGWTISNATSSSSTTRIEGSKSLSLALTGALSLSQSSTINAAQKSGVQMVASIWVNSSDVSDLKLCSLKNGSEDKCTVTGGYVQGSGWRQLTVSFLGDSTSNGLKLKSTDTTGTVLVDQAYVGIGSPVVDFTPDMVYSAQVSSSGVVSGENTDWINGNCSLSTATFTCTFNSGIFTEAPNCVSVTRNTGTTADISTGTSTTTSAATIQTNNNGATSAQPFTLVCQKQGADYKTSKAYVASSSDYGWTDYTPTGSWSTNTTYKGKQRRQGDSIEVQVTVELSGAPNAVDLTFTSAQILNGLGLSVDTTKIAGTGGSQDLTAVGVGAYTDQGTANRGGLTASWDKAAALLKLPGSSFSDPSATSPITWASGDNLTFTAKLPILGWENASVIVGSFQGYNETPGTSRVETFSVSYGTTNATTVCSASPCSYLDQIGNAVTSITRSSAGDYTLNFSKTYSKLKCTYNGEVSDNNVAGPGNDFLPSCSSCSTLRVVTLKSLSGAATDSNGTFVCQGIPQ